MAVTITNTLIAALNTDQALTFNAATSTVDDATEAFTYTPTGKDSKIVIGMKNGTGILSYSIAKGTGVFQAAAAKTGTVSATSTDVIQIETGKFIDDDGKIVITLTPASGTALLTDHAASMFVIELL